MWIASTHAPGAVGVEPQAAAADGLAHGRRVGQVGRFTAADLEVDDRVLGGRQDGGVRGQLVGGVALHEAEVVDLVAHPAAEEPVNRPAGGLAEDVPERHLEAGQGEVGKPGCVVEAAQEARLGAEPLDVADGLANEQRRHGLEGGHGALGRHRCGGFAHADQALVGGDLHEDDRGAVVDTAGPVIRLLDGQPAAGLSRSA